MKRKCDWPEEAEAQSLENPEMCAGEEMSGFYHVARRSNLDSILYYGLLPADDDIAGILRLEVLRVTDDPLANWDHTSAVNLTDDLDHWKCGDDDVILVVAIQRRRSKTATYLLVLVALQRHHSAGQNSGHSKGNSTMRQETDDIVHKLEVAGWRVLRGKWTEEAKERWEFCLLGDDLFAMTREAQSATDDLREGRPARRRLG